VEDVGEVDGGVRWEGVGGAEEEGGQKREGEEGKHGWACWVLPSSREFEVEGRGNGFGLWAKIGGMYVDFLPLNSAQFGRS